MREKKEKQIFNKTKQEEHIITYKHTTSRVYIIARIFLYYKIVVSKL